MKQDQFDVVVVGGAVVGSAVAYFLSALAGPACRVLLLEQDPSYAHSATARSVASIRHQFSTPENIRLSMFGTRFLREAAEQLAVGDERPDLAFHEGGYLFLATAAGWPLMQELHALQRAEGADVALLAPAALQARFPWLQLDDLAGGSLGLSGEGWLDAQGLMAAMRRRAVASGVTLWHARAQGFEVAQGRVQAVQLADGRRVACGWAVNAAGTDAPRLAASAGIALPVEARKRCVFHFTSPAPVQGCPLLIDPSGLYVRPEGQGYLCGIAPPEHEDPPSEDFDVPLQWFEERLWPALAARIPGFEAARLKSAWAGHYDVNLLDHNAILGPHPALPNLLFANGFSGHGVQQAPGVGRALAEWVLHGGWRSLDLSALGWARVLQRRPLRERHVV